MSKRKQGRANHESSNKDHQASDQTSMRVGAETPAEASKIETLALVPSEPANGGATCGTPADVTNAASTEESRGAQPVGAKPATATMASAGRLIPFAAGIALAAAVGAAAGPFVTASVPVLMAGGTLSEVITSVRDVRALNGNIVQMNAALVSLQAAIDNVGKNANGQFAKFGERLDRFERAQAEPAAKLAKIADAMERRTPATSTAANDTTGSVAPLARRRSWPARRATGH
jgi:hypothetical protein